MKAKILVEIGIVVVKNIFLGVEIHSWLRDYENRVEGAANKSRRAGSERNLLCLDPVNVANF